MRIFYFVLLMVFFSTAGARAQNRPVAFADNANPSTVHFYPNPATSIITFDDFAKKYDKNYT
ncbi:MAG TPA: hypothetical protein VGI38_03300, partial [Puia sp.]